MKSTTEMRVEMQGVFLRVTRAGQQGPYQEEERKGKGGNAARSLCHSSSDDFLAYSHSTPAHLEEAYSLWSSCVSLMFDFMDCPVVARGRGIS
jgi:hypothetical protein